MLIDSPLTMTDEEVRGLKKAHQDAQGKTVPTRIIPPHHSVSLAKRANTSVHSALVGLCRCPSLPITPSPSPSVGINNAEPVPLQLAAICHPRECFNRKDLQRLGAICRKALELERKSSNFDEWWQAQVSWLDHAWGKTFRPGETDQFSWAQWKEVLDRDGEYIDADEAFVQGFMGAQAE